MLINSKITIALDAMGGDQGLEPNVKGAIIAANSNPVRILLVGDQIELKKALEKKSYPNGSLEIIHAPEFIGMDESPRESLEKSPEHPSWSPLN
jgi:glycerol-3-phosphate acyltransferase PlsX